MPPVLGNRTNRSGGTGFTLSSPWKSKSMLCRKYIYFIIAFLFEYRLSDGIFKKKYYTLFKAGIRVRANNFFGSSKLKWLIVRLTIVTKIAGDLKESEKLYSQHFWRNKMRLMYLNILTCLGILKLKLKVILI